MEWTFTFRSDVEMKTNHLQTMTAIMDLLQRHTELKVSGLYSGAVLALASQGRIVQRLEGEHFIVKKKVELGE